MSSIYDDKKDADGFLYVTYSGENTFGYQISFIVQSVLSLASHHLMCLISPTII